jgi:RHS repeat-associated protein
MGAKRSIGTMDDSELRLGDNYFRNYDPQTGRYVESDPVGLKAGVNIYGYTLQNPLWYTDSLGLDVQICSRPADLPFPMNLFNHWWVKTSTVEAGMGPQNGQVPAQEGRSDSPGDPGQPLGNWHPFNQCSNFAWSVVTKCRKGPQIPPKPLEPMMSPVEKTVQSLLPKVPK